MIVLSQSVYWTRVEELAERLADVARAAKVVVLLLAVGRSEGDSLDAERAVSPIR